MASEPNTTARILGYLHNLNTRLIVVERRLHTLDDKIDNVSDQLGNAIALLRKDKLENFKVGRGTVLEDKLLRVSGKQYFHSPNRTVSSKRARELIKASLTQREYEGREEKLVSWIKEKFCQWRQEERRKILAKDNGMTKYGTMDTESLVISMCRNKRIKHDTVSMSEVALMRKFARSAYKEEDGDFFHQFKLFRTAENIIEINNDKREQIIAEDKQIDYSAGGFFREENDSQLSPTFPHPL
ncbi:uncharacterized protein [Ptychodera flava]|uniref:uncharacterized protein n=1 Tax=Ptychodera flava TaxID=63121 RepID=UPI003969D45B